MNIQFLIEQIIKHLPGRHNQKAHGHPATFMGKVPGEHDIGGVILNDVDLQIMRHVHKGLEAAAQELHYSQSTMSLLVTAVANKLGIKSVKGKSISTASALTCLAVKTGLIDLDSMSYSEQAANAELTQDDKQTLTYVISGIPSAFLAPEGTNNPINWANFRMHKIYSKLGVEGLSDAVISCLKYGHLDVDDLIEEITQVNNVNFQKFRLRKLKPEIINNLAIRQRTSYASTELHDLGDSSFKDPEAYMLASIAPRDELGDDLSWSNTGTGLAKLYAKLGIESNGPNTSRNRAVVWAVRNNALDLDRISENPEVEKHPLDEWEVWAVTGLAAGLNGKDLSKDSERMAHGVTVSSRITNIKQRWLMPGINTTPELIAYALKYKYITLDEIAKRAKEEGFEQ